MADISTATPPTDHTVHINGLDIHYLDWGGESNKNLLLVHGQGGNAHNWDYIARSLRDEFRVVAIDQRGHGDSDHTWDGYGVQGFAIDLAEFVEKVGLAPCDYVGASLGARNGIAYAGDHSEHLKHFVCLDYGPEMSVASARNQISGMNRRLLGWRSIDEYVELQMQSNPRPGEEYYRNQGKHSLRLNYAGKYVAKSDPDMFWINGSFGVREVPYLWEQWGKITCPIMEMKGGESDFLSSEIKGRMIEAQPSMTWVDVPDSGHGITGDNPDFLLRELRAFFVD